jgi:phospholipid/cholesterol/gamma-HCH transport system substrate-binding protein
MMSTFQANNRNLLEITNDVKVLSKNLTEGKGTVGKLLTDETLMKDLHTTMVTLRRASNNAQSISSDVAEYSAQLQRKGTLANDLVTDTTIFNQLKATASQIQEVSRNANVIVNNLNATTSDLNKRLSNTNTPAGMLLNDEDAAADIRVTLRNLQTASIKLDENLEAVQHNFLLRGFFKKKAKKEAEETKQKEKQP